MSKREIEIDPEDVLLDSSNLSDIDQIRLEGRFERPVSRFLIRLLGGVAMLVCIIYVARLGDLQIVKGSELSGRSERNSLSQVRIEPERATIYDRNGVLLAWNSDRRMYSDSLGLAHVIGYIGLPDEIELEENPNVEPGSLLGKEGVELFYDHDLSGTNGLSIEERNVHGEVISVNIQSQPSPGDELHLSVDSYLSNELYSIIKRVASERGFSGGAGVLMDIETGELIVITSYPEYNPNVIVGGENLEDLRAYQEDTSTPFLSRATRGLYTPGSIVKLFIALAALDQELIDPAKKLLSTGSIRLPHPYEENKFSIFNDWKAHGLVDLKDAIAVSSNVYFYIVGGGFENQDGLGIDLISEYMARFGLGEYTGVDLPSESRGTVPTPEWKSENFDGDPWRIGDTYFTSIGQYGFQVTPLQIVRAVGGLAAGGEFVTPRIRMGLRKRTTKRVPMRSNTYGIVQEGMREAVKRGTASALNVPYLKVAAKTGTAELGSTKQRVNSWVTGYFPYETPKYSFTIVMESGKAGNLVGAASVMREFMDWMHFNTPEYVKESS